IETIELSGKAWCQGRHGTIFHIGNEASGSRRIACDDALPAILADDVAALAKRMDMAVYRLDFLALDARKHHQLEMDRQEIFANDMHVGKRQQIMNIRDA